MSIATVNPMSLESKRIMVTGASSGIGRAVAILCSRLGANIALVGRNLDKLNETKSLLDKGEHTVLGYDLSNEDNIYQLMDECVNSGAKLDGLVHSAGVGPIVPLSNLSRKKMLDVMQINYFAFMQLAMLYSKRKYSNGGSIVGISSISSFAGWKGSSVYSGSKGAVDISVRALAIELAQKNIRINTVVPSNIKTEMFDYISEIAGEDSQAKIIAKQPLGLGSCEDVANAVAFLLSDASRFITGTSLVVDGGYLAE